jgi:5,10-methylenetetrahydromethanopterin reductase
VRRGVWLFPSRPVAELVDAIVAAEEAGLDEVWLADEGVAREPVVVLAAAATRTTRIRLATGITSPVLRHPGAIASSTASLDELSGGRAVLGLGVGGHLALDPFGLRAERPVALMRDAIETARSVLRQEAGDHYDPPAHAMPSREVPIWVGARGPQLVRLAGRLADGLFLSGCPPEQLDEITSNARAGTLLAIYQSAAAKPSSASEHRWDDVVRLLADGLEQHRPASIGINLVEAFHDPPVSLIDQVERASAALRLA